MTAKLRAAVIGCGRMGGITTDRTRSMLPSIWFPLSHAEAINSIQDIELVAVCDKSPEQAKLVATLYEGCESYANHIEMLGKINPDIVGIATRSEGRCQIIDDCCKMGVRGIHAEKPIGRSLKEVHIAVNALKSRNVGFTYGAIRRFMRPYQMAREIIDSGQIGNLKQIIISHGKDMLLWGHPHTVDLALFLHPKSKVISVSAKLQIDLNHVSLPNIDCDPFLQMGHIQYEDNVSCIITEGIGHSLQIFGSNGWVWILNNGEALETWIKNSYGGYQCLHKKNFNEEMPSGTEQAFINLLGYINYHKPLGLTLDEVIENQKILTGFVWSSLNGSREISLNELPNDIYISGRYGELYA
jgi:scyllo-inositol 2-dehydrogenase (NAD+)